MQSNECNCQTGLKLWALQITFAISVAKTVREIEEKINTAIRKVITMLDEAGLTLAVY